MLLQQNLADERDALRNEQKRRRDLVAGLGPSVGVTSSIRAQQKALTAGEYLPTTKSLSSAHKM